MEETNTMSRITKSFLRLSFVLAVLLGFSSRAVLAQETVTVDQDGGEDELNIQAGLSTLNTAVGNNTSTTTGILVVIAGDYTSDGNIAVNGGGVTSNIDDLIIEVRRDASSNTDELTIESLDLKGGTNVAVRTTNGSEFVQITNAGSNSNDLDLVGGTLLIEEASNRLRVGGGSRIFRTANAEIDGSGFAPTFPTNVNVRYDVSADDVTAGLELPSDLGSGTLDVTAGANTLTVGSDVAASTFSLVNGADADFQGGLSVGAGVSVGANSQLDVANTLTIENNNQTLSVAGTANLGNLTFASYDGSGMNLISGGGELDVGTVTVTPNLNDNATDDTFDAVVNANASSSDFTIATVSPGSESDGDETDNAVVDVTNTADGTVAVGGTVRNVNNASASSTLQLTGGTITGSLNNSSSGSVTVSGNVTYNFASAGSAIDNSGSGNIAIAGGNTLTITDAGDGGQTGINVLANNGANNGGVTGSGTIALKGDSGDSFTITTNLDEDNLLPSVTANVATTINDDGDNANANKISIGDLTANANVTLSNDNVTGSSAATAEIAGTLTVNSGTVDAGAANTITTARNVQLNDGGTLDISDIEFQVSRNFTRAGRPGAVLTSNANTELAFTQSVNGTFDTGSIFTLNGLMTVDKPNFSLTLQEAIRVNGDVTIVDPASPFIDTHFVLKDNLIMSGGGSGTFTLDSKIDTQVDAQGDSTFVLFEDANDTVAGTDTLDNVVVQTGGGNINVAGSTTLEFRGQLELRSGGIAVPTGSDLSPVGGSARVVRWINSAATQISGSFNDDGNPYDLLYTKSGSNNTASELTDDVRDLTVDAGSQPQLDDDYNVNGMLTVNGTIGDDGTARTLFLKADSASHSIAGTIGDTNGVTVQVDGNGVTLQGSTSSGSGVAEVQHLIVEGSGTTVTNLQRITGNLTLNQDGTLTLGLAGPDSGDQTVAGNVTVSDSLDLASDVNVTSADGTDDVKVNGTGRINFASGDLMITGSGADFHGDANAAYYSDGGNLVFDGGSNPTFGTAGEWVPRVVVDQAINLSEDVATSTWLDLNANVALGSNDWNFMGNVELAANVSGSGIFRAMGTTITAEGNQSISNFTVNADTNTVNVETDDPANPRTTTVTGVFRLQSGTLSYGPNHIRLTGGSDALDYNDGELAATDGNLVLDGSGLTADLDSMLTVPNLLVSTDAALGDDDMDLRVSQRLTLDAAFDAEANNSDGDLVIGDGAWIIRDDGDAGSSVLAEALVFEGMYNLKYMGSANYTSSFEVDTDTTISDVVVDVAGSVGSVYVNSDSNVLTGPWTVNGTLDLQDGNLDYGRQLHIADGATVRRDEEGALADAGSAADGDTDDPSQLVADGEYWLVYDPDAGVVTTRANEFVDGGVVHLQSMSTNGADVQFEPDVQDGFDRTVATLLVNNSGNNAEFDLRGRTLTVEDTSVVQAGRVDDDLDDDGNAGAIVAKGDFHVEGGVIDVAVQTTADVLFTGGQFGGSSSLTFNGQGEQQLQLAQNDGVNQLVLSQMADGVFPRVTLSGGNLSIGSLIFDNGLLDTGDNRVSVTTFNRDNVESDEASHIVGTMRQTIGQGFTGRLEYPVGTDTASTIPLPQYRPYALTFNDPAITGTSIDVRHVDESPQGTVGLPLDGGEGVSVGNYPDYYWLVDATTSLGTSQTFDVEMTGTEPFGLSFEEEEDVRIIRRFDGNAETNQWKLQGSGANYDNILSVEGSGANTDSTIVVRNIGSTGGIVTQGARFTIGFPSRAPAFTVAPAPTDTFSVKEDSTLTSVFAAEGRDVDSELAFSLQNAPKNASIATVDGLDASINAAQSVTNGGVGGGSSPGSGSAAFAVNTSNGSITSIDYEITLTGLDLSAFVEGADSTTDPDDDVVGMHIHNAARGEQGGIVFGILGSPSQNGTLDPTLTDDDDRTFEVTSSGVVVSGSWEPDEVTDPNDFADAILNNALGEDVPLYVNVHTSGNQGGEIRGQLQVRQVGRFTFTPSFDQQGTYGITAVVTDNSNSLTAKAPFTVVVEDNAPPIMLGDPSDDGEVTSADASLVLQFVVGLTDFTLAQQNAADVSGDGTVNAADASLIQQFVVGLIDEFPAAKSGGAAIAAKNGVTPMSTVSGQLAWGELQAGDDGQMRLPITLTGDVENVRSVQLTAEFNTDVISIKSVEANLPSGWQIAHNAQDGTLRIALAGARPVGAGKLADIVLDVSEDANASFSGTAILNTSGEQQIGAAEVRSLPSTFTLEANYPNPFRNSTTIVYELPKDVKVTLEVYNVLGQQVTTLVNGKQSAGRHEVNFDASGLSSGMYIYRIKAGSFTQTNQMTVVR